MLNLFLAVVRRDLMLALRQKTDIVQTLFFFAVVITLVPLGVGAEQNLLRSMAPGVVWVAALLAALLSLPRIFAFDYADGTLEQMLISAEPLTVIVLAKVFAHWIVTAIRLSWKPTICWRFAFSMRWITWSVNCLSITSHLCSNSLFVRKLRNWIFCALALNAPRIQGITCLHHYV